MSYSTVELNSQALIHNLKLLPTQNICAMVKANAYGLGVDWVCQTLKNKVRFFGVATLMEALEIRKFDAETPILIVGYCESFYVASSHNISVTIESISQLEKAIIFCKKNPLKIHLKINTGMNRFGIKSKKILKKIIKILKNNKNLIFEGIYTHFYFTENQEITLKQLNKFNGFLKCVPYDETPICHVGGTGVLNSLPSHLIKNFMVRVGIGLYEKEVVKIKSKLIKVFEINRGEWLGYSGGFRANRKTKVGVVPLGYADGVNRALSNNGYVQVLNQSVKIIGNICMDVFFVDLTYTSAQVGAEVVVFDSAEEWAKVCGTISYEILTSLNFSRMEKVVL